MIEIEIPGYKKLRLDHLVLDYNGTIAVDGEIVEGVKENLDSLSQKLSIHVLTADTFGSVEANLQGLPCQLSVLPMENQDAAKLRYVEALGTGAVVTIGNGRNDAGMLKVAVLGIAVLQEEGTAMAAFTSADLCITSISEALDLLLHFSMEEIREVGALAADTVDAVLTAEFGGEALGVDLCALDAINMVPRQKGKRKKDK